MKAFRQRLKIVSKRFFEKKSCNSKINPLSDQKSSRDGELKNITQINFEINWKSKENPIIFNGYYNNQGIFVLNMPNEISLNKVSQLKFKLGEK